MKRTTLHEVVIDHYASWGKWPNTANANFSTIINTPFNTSFATEDVLLTVVSHMYPAYSAYYKAGLLQLPEGLPVGAIDTRKPPPTIVLQAQIEDMKEYAKTCQIVRWRHGFQLYPEVSKQLPTMFPCRIFEFGDDMPGSSEYKSFPHAPYFNALVYNMYINDFFTGARTAETYKSLGVKYTHFAMLPYSSGIYEYITESAFDFDAKMGRIASGELLPIGCIFVGCLGCNNTKRIEFLKGLAAAKANLASAIGGTASRLHTQGLGDGILTPYHHPRGDGLVTGPLYTDALFGPNMPVTSIFNSRLHDLWMLGVIQLIYDPHHELTDFGMMPDEHFIAFDGTIEDCIRKMQSWNTRRSDLVRIARQAKDKAEKLRKTYSHYNAYKAVYLKYVNGDFA